MPEQTEPAPAPNPDANPTPAKAEKPGKRRAPTGPKVAVKALVPLFEGNQVYQPGETFEVLEERAKALGPTVEIVPA